MTFLYFTYGSNMLSSRLIARCPSAKVVGKATAAGHALEFSKRSVDTSGRATLVATADHKIQTPGVLFEIKRSELALLDAAEGKGYDRREGFTIQRDSSTETVVTYLATETDAQLKPFDWYLALVIAGAHEHCLGEDHLNMLRMIAYKRDDDPTNKFRAKALEALVFHGYHDHLTLLRTE